MPLNENGWPCTESGLSHILHGVTTSDSEKTRYVCYDDHWGKPVIWTFPTKELAKVSQAKWDGGERTFGSIDENEDDDTGCGVLVKPEEVPGAEKTEFTPCPKLKKQYKKLGERAMREIVRIAEKHEHKVDVVTDKEEQRKGHDLIVDGSKEEIKGRRETYSRCPKIYAQITERNPKGSKE